MHLRKDNFNTMKITVKLLKSLVYYYYQYLFLFFLLISVSASANQNSASQLSNYHHTVLNSAPAVPNSANNAGFRGTGPNNVLHRTAGGNLGPAGFNIEVELGKKIFFSFFLPSKLLFSISITWQEFSSGEHIRVFTVVKFI